MPAHSSVLDDLDDPKANISPGDYVRRMSVKLNFYFTMEYIPSSNPFTHTDKVLDRSVNSVGNLVAELEAKIPDGRVVLDRSDKNHLVIHLIDKNLGKKAEWLDKKVDLQYSGAVGNLPAEFKKHGVPEIDDRGAIVPASFMMHTNLITKVDVAAKQQSVRDILSHCVNLDRFNRLIWLAETIQFNDGTWKTLVFYPPPDDEN